MIKIGILGLGSMGTRHLKNFRELGCEVVGYDPISTPYKNFDEVFGCDAIVVASPSKAHCAHIMMGHEAAKPMLVEKPLVMTRKELEEVPLTHVWMVGYNLRFHSCVRRVRRWLGEGLIGKPLWARFTCAQFSDRDPYYRDGVVLNWSHELDLALHLLGDGEVVCASTIKSDGNEVLSDIVLVHPRSGCQTTIHLDYLTKPEQRGFLIAGDQGIINVDLVRRTASCRDANDDAIHGFFGDDCWDSNYMDEATAFLALVEGKITPKNMIGCTAAEAHAVMEICLTAKEYHE